MPLFCSLISSNFLKFSRGREVTVTAGIGHIKDTCSRGSDGYGRFMSVDTGSWHSGSWDHE